MKAKRKRLTTAGQSARFIETARNPGADERPEQFEKAFKRVVPSKKPAKRR